MGKGWPRARLARCRRGEPSLSDRPAPSGWPTRWRKKTKRPKIQNSRAVRVHRSCRLRASWPVGKVARGIHCASRTAQIDISFFRQVMHCTQGHARAHAGAWCLAGTCPPYPVALSPTCWREGGSELWASRTLSGKKLQLWGLPMLVTENRVCCRSVGRSHMGLVVAQEVHKQPRSQVPAPALPPVVAFAFRWHFG